MGQKMRRVARKKKNGPVFRRSAEDGVGAVHGILGSLTGLR
jgi:hypothetical protein